MAESHSLVHIVDDAEAEAAPVLLVALNGFLDSGRAAPLAADHLISDGPAPVVATFDIDSLYDYRARRPAVTFAHDRYVDYDTPRLVVRRLRDRNDKPYLILRGPEPDVRWEAFSEAVAHVVERLGVELTVAMGSVPMAVPHTRPVVLTSHGTRPALVSGTNAWSGEVRVPSSAQALMEIRLGERGHDAAGFVAHVPHYLAEGAYPAASVAMLARVAELTGLDWDLEALVSAAREREAEIGEQIQGNEEVAGVVAGLEQQYDAFVRAEGTGGDLMATGSPLPTGDELGGQIEAFLAGLDTPGAEADGPEHPDRAPGEGPDETPGKESPGG